MKIGIMGGTFNPVHNAHLILAEFAKEEFRLDKILFMPSGNPPHKKNSEVIDSDDRLEMVRIATYDNADFEVSDYEIEKHGYSYTAETLEHLKLKYPNDEFAFIIGSDSLLSLSTWHQPEKILELCTILVFERIGYGKNLEEKIAEYNKRYNSKINLLHAPKFEISSSLMRKRIENNQSVKYLIPDKVIEYIAEHGLYNIERSDKINEK